MPKLRPDFYTNHDVIAIARLLLGKVLYTNVNNCIVSGIIVETEAYHGIEDKACHAYGGRLTARTQTMYSQGGVAYVYLCYGVHYLLNVVTATQGHPHAVLIRGLQPLSGIEAMLERRKMDKLQPKLTAGPGALGKAMGIDKQLNGANLQGNQIWIEDSGMMVPSAKIVASARIGIAYAQEHAALPWRFYIKGNPYVSKPNS